MRAAYVLDKITTKFSVLWDPEAPVNTAELGEFVKAVIRREVKHLAREKRPISLEEKLRLIALAHEKHYKDLECEIDEPSPKNPWEIHETLTYTSWNEIDEEGGFYVKSYTWVDHGEAQEDDEDDEDPEEVNEDDWHFTDEELEEMKEEDRNAVQN